MASARACDRQARLETTPSRQTEGSRTRESSHAYQAVLLETYRHAGMPGGNNQTEERRELVRNRVASRAQPKACTRDAGQETRGGGAQVRADETRRADGTRRSFRAIYPGLPATKHPVKQGSRPTSSDETPAAIPDRSTPCNIISAGPREARAPLAGSQARSSRAGTHPDGAEGVPEMPAGDYRPVHGAH